MGDVNRISNGIGIGKHTKLLWTHPNPDSTRMTEFMRKVNGKYGLHLKTYEDLYRWSIDSLSEFWGEAWDFTGVTVSKPFDEVGGEILYISRDISIDIPPSRSFQLEHLSFLVQTSSLELV